MYGSVFARPRALSLTLLLATVAIAGCDSNDDGPGGSGGNVTFRADGDRVSLAGGAGIVSGLLSLGAADAGGDVSAGFIVEDGEGTYDIEDDEIFAFYEDEDGNTYNATSGTIRIEDLDDNSVSGTFEFDAETEDGDEISITDGEFDVRVEDVDV